MPAKSDKNLTNRRINHPVIIRLKVNRPPTPNQDYQPNDQRFRHRMHKQVNKMKQPIIEPRVKVSNITEGLPSEAGNLSRSSNEHDKLMEISFYVCSSEVVCEEVEQP